MRAYLIVNTVLEVCCGKSSNGTDWERQTVVFDTTGESKRQLAIDFMGERRTQTTKKLKVGQLCEVVYEPSSREYSGKWYTNLEGISCRPMEQVKIETEA